MTTFTSSGLGDVTNFDPAKIPTLEKMAAFAIQALAQVNTPQKRIELRQGVSEVAIQWSSVETYEGATGWYFVGNIILPMDKSLVSSGTAWEAVTELSDDSEAPFPGEFLTAYQ